jgi:hypothetical protein
VEDPVEGPTLGALPIDTTTELADTTAVADEAPAAKPKRRRRAVSPTTTV